MDARTDVYALGCVLHRCLTGQPPYAGGPAAVMWGHVNEDPPAPSRLRPELPGGVDQVVARAMAKRPADRYASAGEVAAALAAEPRGADPPQVVAGRPAERERRLVSVLVAHVAPAEGADVEDAEALLDGALAAARESVERFGAAWSNGPPAVSCARCSAPPSAGRTTPSAQFAPSLDLAERLAGSEGASVRGAVDTGEALSSSLPAPTARPLRAARSSRRQRGRLAERVLASPGEVLVGEAAVRAAGNRFELEDRARRDGDAVARRVLRPRSSLGVGVGRPVTALIGRRAEASSG